jgi:hypothetical protein
MFLVLGNAHQFAELGNSQKVSVQVGEKIYEIPVNMTRDEQNLQRMSVDLTDVIDADND